ncbi:hypothetical protein A1O7_01703 [Cladophialophora yegresii CBS 114405]|uniref:Uncharacterized protein n=1 Tax=Cladophialophora yegresii CBS 114405 TaxID=1182544 RepID=W9WBA5_9EURO|nr:uncharacterized protein A1O7_01703 [Cladophialophora yegresii CBS 114405]EXJ65362.1 hypothetical protein A1O7_01703 [Cladophialophora yegresii CBS 114405]
MTLENTRGSPRVDAFLHGGTTVCDFILLERGSQVPAVVGTHATKFRQEDLGRFDNERNRVGPLMEFMDAITNQKMVREAVVYRPILVDCG